MPTLIILPELPSDKSKHSRSRSIHSQQQQPRRLNLSNNYESDQQSSVRNLSSHSRFGKSSSIMRSMVLADAESENEIIIQNSIPEEMSINSSQKLRESSEDVKAVGTAVGGDIRGSSRLSGYLYILLSSAVNVASVVQFGRNEKIDFNFLFKKSNSTKVIDEFTNCALDFIAKEVNNDNASIYNETGTGEAESVDDFFIISEKRVYVRKFVGAFIITVLGTIFSLIIVMAHFDTICCPQLWRNKVFRDGSLWERNISLLQILFWTAGVHICTSSFSIGFTQPNVFFTTWIALVSAFQIYDQWRISAQLPSLFLAWEEFPLKTTTRSNNGEKKKTTVFNWFWSALFAVATAGAITDIFLSRKYYKFLDQDSNVRTYYTEENWRIGLSSTWAITLLNIMMLITKIHFTNKKLNINILYYYFEGIIVISMIGLSGWLVLSDTIHTFYSKPTNIYIGAWGYFFSMLFTFGTWIGEQQQQCVTFTMEQQLSHVSSSDEEEQISGEIIIQ